MLQVLLLLPLLVHPPECPPFRLRVPHSSHKQLVGIPSEK
jgi:hypothetical protein